MNNYSKKVAFTLIELIIVVTVIAIVATIATVGVLRSRITANEGSAIGTLKGIANAQCMFQNQIQVDQNSNGSGEFGIFAEITGAAKLRGKNNTVGTSFLSRSMDPVINGVFASRSGYFYQIYLPGNPNPLTDKGIAGLAAYDPKTEEPAIGAQENRWLCYTWPGHLGISGMRVFTIGFDGELYMLANRDAKYNGVTVSPNANTFFKPVPAPDSYLKGEPAIGGQSCAVNGGEVWFNLK